MRSPLVQSLQLLWFGIFFLWAVTRFSSRRTVVSQSEGRARGAVWIVLIAWIILLTESSRRGVLALRFVPAGRAGEYVGAVLTVVGLGFATWARFTIGRNWSAMITLQEHHQLTRTGPYGIVRHPIYSGFMLATLGTAIAYGELAGLLSFVMIVLAWGYKATLEEVLMVEQFGAEYERYRREVKALLPFVW